MNVAVRQDRQLVLHDWFQFTMQGNAEHMSNNGTSPSSPPPKKSGANANPPRRSNRLQSISDAVGGVLDPVLQKRGFASREILERWEVIVPSPYCRQTLPDELVWSRNEDAATLVLRCAASARLLVTHDAQLVIGAVNRYFGYVLVSKIKLSVASFTPRSDEKRQDKGQISTEDETWVRGHVTGIDDERLDKALYRLGAGIKSRRNK